MRGLLQRYLRRRYTGQRIRTANRHPSVSAIAMLARASVIGSPVTVFDNTGSGAVMSPSSSIDIQLLASFYEGISKPQRFAQGLQRMAEQLQCERVSLHIWDRRGDWSCVSEAIRRDGNWTLSSNDEALPDPALRALISKFEPGSWKLLEQLHRSTPGSGVASRGDGNVLLCKRIMLQRAEAVLTLQRRGRAWKTVQIEQARDACRAMLPALEPIAQHKQLAQQSSRFSAMLDSLRIPMALIDTSQRMLAANASARQMFDLSARSSSGRIVIALPGVSPTQFAQLIRGACGTPAIGGVLPVQFSPASTGAHVLVMPLQNQHLTQQKPAALVLVQGLAIASVHAHQLLQHLYRLTPAEARLAVLILDGQSPSRVASALQLSVTTVRTQLSAVLKKTGAQRQSDLVRRLAPLMLLEKHLAAS